VLTAAERGGDFSAMLQGTTPIQLYNPFAVSAASGSLSREHHSSHHAGSRGAENRRRYQRLPAAHRSGIGQQFSGANHTTLTATKAMPAWTGTRPTKTGFLALFPEHDHQSRHQQFADRLQLLQ